MKRNTTKSFLESILYTGHDRSKLVTSAEGESDMKQSEAISKLLEGLDGTTGRISHHRAPNEQKALFYDRSPAAGSPRIGEAIDMHIFRILRDQGLIILETDSPDLRIYKISDTGLAHLKSNHDQIANLPTTRSSRGFDTVNIE